MEPQQTDILIIARTDRIDNRFWLTRAGKDIHILEKADRVGGQIHTFREKDFVYESGPNTGVVSYPEVAELFEALSPACALETAREEVQAPAIWKGTGSGLSRPDCSVQSRLLCSRLVTSSVSSESRFGQKAITRMNLSAS